MSKIGLRVLFIDNRVDRSGRLSTRLYAVEIKHAKRVARVDPGEHRAGGVGRAYDEIRGDTVGERHKERALLEKTVRVRRREVALVGGA